MANLKKKNLFKTNELVFEILPGSEVEQNVCKKKNFEKFLKYISLIVLVIQNAGQVILIRIGSTRNHEPFLKTVIVFFSEVTKFFASLILLTLSHGSLINALKDLRYYFIYNFLETIKVGVPAFIYTIQNFLLFISIENLDPGTYMVTYQLKTITTAFFTVLLLKRRISIFQWFSLLILACGVAIVQISASSKKEVISNELNANLSLNNSFALLSTTSSTITTTYYKEQNVFVGLGAVIIACFLSGFSGIYFEKILKESNASIWLCNVQLAFFSIIISIFMIIFNNGNDVIERGLFQGFDLLVWCIVLFQAFGGLIVAVVIKYADNILKAFATSIAIILSSIAGIFLFSHYPKLLFILGTFFVITAVIIYTIFPYKVKNNKTNYNEDIFLHSK